MFNFTKIFAGLFKPLIQVSDTRRDLDKTATQLGFNELLNYMMIYKEKVILMKDGAFAATFVYRGRDVESSTSGELDQIVASLNQSLRLTDSGWMVEFNLVRLHSTEYSAMQQFPDTVSQMIENERRRQYQTEGTHFDTLTYVTLTYMPEPAVRSWIQKLFLTTDQKQVIEEDDELIRAHRLFEERLTGVLNSVAPF